MNSDFMFVDERLPAVRWDAKCATWDNFTGKPVDGYGANRIVATTALCAALQRAQAQAASIGLGLLLWDGYRPQRAVDRFLAWAEEPEDGRTKLRHYPNVTKTETFTQGYVAAKSAHSRGSAVDLTLYDLPGGALVRMGGGFDLMDAVSHHDDAGVIEVEAGNRRRLRSLMQACGFRSYQREWWHYELVDESYPDTYFDVPITSNDHRRRRWLRSVSNRRGGRVRASQSI